VLAGDVLVDIPLEPILTTKKGERVLHTRKVCIRGAEGETKYLLGISEDITEQKKAEAMREQLEEQLRSAQKMEAIGSLAGGVAHDFNNLLSVILSYTSFALEALSEDHPIKNDLLEVREAGRRAAGLTRQLLAFSRKQVLQPVALSLNDSAAGVETLLRRILGEDIDLVRKQAPDLSLTLADPGQIEQVLMNLAVNARDAMPEGGKLTIETSNVEIDEEYIARHVAVTPGSYVQLAVSDTGCGMDEQTRARIFEPFFTTKEKDKGTGLGLSTVYGIVKQSGGNVWVYSELGQGTTFKIYLPRYLSVSAAAALKPARAPRLSTGTETILVVEDEEALRKVALRTLGAGGYKVLIAANGDEALLASAQHAGDIHLLLTDVVMPGMSGRVLAQNLSRARPAMDVLYMSGYTDDAIVHHGVLDAGVQFLAKPFTAADLARKVREVLDSGIPSRVDVPEPAGEVAAEVEKKQIDWTALGKVPGDMLCKLRTAVIAARYDEIVEVIETIRTTEPGVATGLGLLADRFDYDGLRSVLGDSRDS
jgi:signal transduction histidine kinase/ActR/RegA family two-component response regulator